MIPNYKCASNAPICRTRKTCAWLICYILLEVGPYGRVLQVPWIKQLWPIKAQLLTAPQEHRQVVLLRTQIKLIMRIHYFIIKWVFWGKLCFVLVTFSENSTHQSRNWCGQSVDFLHQSWFYSTQEPGFRTKNDRFLIVSPTWTPW